MTPERSANEMRELLGAYALNALDPEERAQVDAFLLSDPEARAELHELEHAAAWLGHASLRPPAVRVECDRGRGGAGPRRIRTCARGHAGARGHG